MTRLRRSFWEPCSPAPNAADLEREMWFDMEPSFPTLLPIELLRCQRRREITLEKKRKRVNNDADI